MCTRTHPFPHHIYHQCMYTEAFRLISHIYTHNVDVWARPKANRCRPACAQIFTLMHCKGLFTDSTLTSMTHKQLPFSPMKGDPLPWHGTSRCITKPHSLIMASASFSYTGKHLLIFVTSTLSLKVLTCHSGAQISIFCKRFCLKPALFFLEHDCAMRPDCTVQPDRTSSAECQPALVAKN